MGVFGPFDGLGGLVTCSQLIGIYMVFVVVLGHFDVFLRVLEVIFGCFDVFLRCFETCF